MAVSEYVAQRLKEINATNARTVVSAAVKASGARSLKRYKPRVRRMDSRSLLSESKRAASNYVRRVRSLPGTGERALWFDVTDAYEAGFLAGYACKL